MTFTASIPGGYSPNTGEFTRALHNPNERFPVQEEKPAVKKPDVDFAHKMTLGMYSLASVSSQQDIGTQVAQSTMRKIKRKGMSAGADQLADLISRYDNAATGPTLAGSATPVNKIDQFVHNRLPVQGHLDKLRDLNNKYELYSMSGLFGVGRLRSQHFTVQNMGNSAGRQLIMNSWRETAGRNFANARWMPTLPQGMTMTPWNFIKYGVVGEQVRRISQFLATGQGFFQAALYSLSLGFLGLNTALTMKRAYDKSAEKQDGIGTRIFKVLKAGTKELIKCVAAMQVSALAYMAVYGAVALPVAGAAAAMFGSALAGVATYNILKKIMGSSTD